MPIYRSADRMYEEAGAITILEKPKENLFLLETTGFSMHPFVKSGDKIVAKKVNTNQLRIGDIILYKDRVNNQNVCHRLVKKRETENGLLLFARGDSTVGFGEPLSESDIMGLVLGVIRNGRFKSLSSKSQIIINWFIAKFYIFCRPVVISLVRLLKKSAVCRKFIVYINSEKPLR